MTEICRQNPPLKKKKKRPAEPANSPSSFTHSLFRFLLYTRNSRTEIKFTSTGLQHNKHLKMYPDALELDFAALSEMYCELTSGFIEEHSLLVQELEHLFSVYQKKLI